VPEDLLSRSAADPCILQPNVILYRKEASLIRNSATTGEIDGGFAAAGCAQLDCGGAAGASFFRMLVAGEHGRERWTQN
jgi:hypothetical protein